jgi:hypothetical protein
VPNWDYLRVILGAMVTGQMILDDGTTAGSWSEAERARGQAWG